MIKDNWITTSLDKRTKDNLNDFSISIRPQNFKVDTFRNNSIRVAKEIFESYDNVHLLYSGGLDSEYVFKVFLEQNLPIKTILISTPFNKEETKFAIDFYKTHGQKPHIITYTKNEIIDAISAKCMALGYAHPIGALPLLVSDQIKSLGFNLVTGLGEPFVTGVPTNIQEKLSDYYNLPEHEFYLHHYDKSHPGAFYTYDIALHHSMLKDMVHTGDIQKDKSVLYGLEYRDKMRWSREFIEITSESMSPKLTLPKVNVSHIHIKKDRYIKAIERNLIR